MRRLSLTFAMLLMGISLANIAVADGPEKDLLLQIISPAPELMSSETAPGCKAELSPLDNVLAAATQMCGSCSPSSICQGVQINSYCGGGRYCRDLYGSFCPAEPLTHECWCTDRLPE